MNPSSSIQRFQPLTAGPMELRGDDGWGSGAFGAPRGTRLHRGLDILAQPRDEIRAPIEGEIVREAVPYEDDPRYSGVLVRGTGPWEGYEVKLFYLDGRHAGSVKAGDVLGRAQDLRLKYPGILNHVHLEVRRHGDLVNPGDLLEPSQVAGIRNERQASA